MGQPYFITALATPLDEDEALYEPGLEIEIAGQLSAGIHGLLVGGTMGAMQLLTEETYRRLATRSVDMAAGRAEVMVGAGDAGFARTRDRIRFLNTLSVDGVVVPAPYLMPFSQDELLDYFRALADFSQAPLYLYDLPQLTRTKLQLDTVLRLAEHPNIRGIKCSDEPTYARLLHDDIGDRFRIIMAVPLLLDVLLRHGIYEHLDGIFCLCPRRIAALGKAVACGQWKCAAQIQQGINALVALLREHGVWSPFTCLMNELGTPGRFKPRPHRQWDAAETEAFLSRKETQDVLTFLRTDEEEALTPTLAHAEA